MAEVNTPRSKLALSVVWSIGPRTPETATELLSAEVGRVLGIPAQAVRLSRACPRCGGSDHGKPVVLRNDATDMPFVSLSRADDVVVVAVSGCGPVGVDIERLDAPRFAGFDEVALHDHEIASTIAARATTWVRKESLLKATGTGLRVDPRLIRLSGPSESPRLIDWAAPGPPELGVEMEDLDIEGHAACVTVLSDQAPRLTLRQEVPVELPR